jgi:predicted deacylase
LDPKESTIAYSVQDRPITAAQFPGTNDLILIIAAMHGDEPKSTRLANALIDALKKKAIGNRQEGREKSGASQLEIDMEAQNAMGDRQRGRSSSKSGQLRAPNRIDLPIINIVPILNPDGYARRRRKNANQVDLNRNFPTENWQRTPTRHRYHGGPSPASEPETRALIKLVDSTKPKLIITIHSISLHRQCNNYDGPARQYAEILAQHNHYPVTESIGYPTPGSFGTWAGQERNIPTITLELPSHISPKKCTETNLPGLGAIFGHFSNGSRSIETRISR